MYSGKLIVRPEAIANLGMLILVLESLLGFRLILRLISVIST